MEFECVRDCLYSVEHLVTISPISLADHLHKVLLHGYKVHTLWAQFNMLPVAIRYTERQ